MYTIYTATMANAHWPLAPMANGHRPLLLYKSYTCYTHGVKAFQELYSYTTLYSIQLLVDIAIQPLQHPSARLWHARIEREERVARLGRVGSG